MDCQLSYEHNMRDGSDFLEADLGVEFIYGYAVGLNAAVGYNFMIAQPEWTQKGKLLCRTSSQGWLSLGRWLSRSRSAGRSGVFF